MAVEKLSNPLRQNDFTDLDNFANGFPHDLFAIHRRVARFDDVRVVAPVEWARSNRHTGIRHLVVELRGAA
jgi:hypothetical protein